MNDNKHNLYEEYAAKWLRCRAATKGQAEIRKGGETFLPKLSGQTDAGYNAYLMRASYFNASGRTLDGLVGMVFRKPMEVVAPAGLQDIIDDIDLSGTPLDGLAMNIVRDVIQVGRIGALVEYPQVTEQPRSLADASISNQRPYVSLYPAESIIDWKEARINNVMQPVMIKLMETHEEKKSEFEYKTEPQIRALLLLNGVYTQQIYRQDNGKKWVQVGGDIVPLMNNASIPFIPFWAFGAEKNTLELQSPPIEPLVDLNISHYMASADYENGCHITGIPTPILAGFTFKDNEAINLGAGGGYATQDPNAKWGFLEFTGQGLGSLLENLKMKEAQMAAIGARFLAPDKSGVEAATTLQMRTNGETSVLAATANLVSQNLKDMFEFIAQWAGITSGEINIKLSTDFLPVAMSSQDLDALIKSWQAGGIPKEELFHALKRGEIITDISYEDYSTALEAEKETVLGVV